MLCLLLVWENVALLPHLWFMLCIMTVCEEKIDYKNVLLREFQRNVCKNKAFAEWCIISEMQFLAFFYSVGGWLNSFLFFSSLTITLELLYSTLKQILFFFQISFVNQHCKYVVHLLWIKVLIDPYCASMSDREG